MVSVAVAFAGTAASRENVLCRATGILKRRLQARRCLANFLSALAVLQGCGRRELPHGGCGGDICGRCCILRKGALWGWDAIGQLAGRHLW